MAALVNRADERHAAAADWLMHFRGELLSTEAVMIEAAYLLARRPEHQRAALQWVQRARAPRLMRIEPVADHAVIAAIMARYVSLPCDYADASLIDVAERSGVAAIATIDRRDFSGYRIRGRGRFRILVGS